MKPFIIKYFPKHETDVIGQAEPLKQLKSFVTGFKNKKKRSLLIYGPTGCGKTSAVYAVANAFNLELVEVNASDFRNKEQIDLKLGSAIKQQSLFSKGKIILVDEVDGLAGREDFGGIQALTKLIEKTTFPVIATANDLWHKKFANLRKKSETLEFNNLTANDISQVLEKICKAEKLDYDETALKTLARKVGGDLRAAINDLESLTRADNKLTKQDVEDSSERNKLESVISALTKIFKTTDPLVAASALNNVKEDLDQVMLWVDENLPKEYTDPEDLANAYDCLSKADIFKRRIKRWQHWRFLVYINSLLTVGVALSKKQKYKHFVSYKPTTRILKLWMAKMKYAKRKAIAQKIAEHTHSSAKEVTKSTLPYLQVIFKKDKPKSEAIAQELELNEEEVAWLRK